MTLNAIIKDTAADPDACVIWLHGLGANGHDFEPIVPELGLPANSAIRFIFPHAPQIAVTVNGGHRMPAWYDIMAMNIEREVDERQLRVSARAIQALIEQQIALGIDSRRIILAGFSQGGAVAYEAALSFDKPLGGLVAMSTYLATADSLERHAANAALPIQVLHGTRDAVVPELLGTRACQQLKLWGYTPQFHNYNMEHSVCGAEITDISRFFSQCLGLKSGEE
ncbi:carboxylesterase [Oceanisphaera profunda]|uniref:Carboxylesterase n=1 Tax=Oceanisphaera profunda TaxID=1416627 RepID=A0A1Y0D6P3_9GAMM|nr:alpha/beta fold hydrolase [Oceanisphaera profunda]ART83209.1 carboxylesterase [Oceanisphaera profunda]